VDCESPRGTLGGGQRLSFVLYYHYLCTDRVPATMTVLPDARVEAAKVTLMAWRQAHGLVNKRHKHPGSPCTILVIQNPGAISHRHMHVVSVSHNALQEMTCLLKKASTSRAHVYVYIYVYVYVYVYIYIYIYIYISCKHTHTHTHTRTRQ
jgi:hypothetical protein